MKRARSEEAFVRLGALSVQVRRRGRRGQLKHAHNDHARIVAVACGSLGSGGRRPVDGLGRRDKDARGPTRACSRGSGACRTRVRGQAAAWKTWPLIAMTTSLVAPGHVASRRMRVRASGCGRRGAPVPSPTAAPEVSMTIHKMCP